MNHDHYDDSYIRGILNTVKTIAMVGASAKDNRPSYFAFKYLGERGYNRQQAYAICSVAVDLKISEMVDVPNFVVSAFLPLDVFI